MFGADWHHSGFSCFKSQEWLYEFWQPGSQHLLGRARGYETRFKDASSIGTVLSTPSKLKHPFISTCEGSVLMLIVIEKNVVKHRTRIAKSPKDQASGKIQSTWLEWPAFSFNSKLWGKRYCSFQETKRDLDSGSVLC